MFETPVKTTATHIYPFFMPSHVATPDKAARFTSEMQRRAKRDRETLLYIHIPYCLSHCLFCHCGRTTLPGGRSATEVLDEYLALLYKEMEIWARAGAVGNIRYVHVGGGTPSLLSVEQFDGLIRKLKSLFSFPQGLEINIEGEIQTLNDEAKIAAYSQLPISRISFGVQTFHEPSRRICNLRPTHADILECVDRLRKHRFAITIDLLYGLPGQDMETVEADLRETVRLKVDSLDIYRVNLYPGQFIYEKYAKSHPQMLDERLKYEMYDRIIDHMTAAGYEHLTDEIFSLPGGPYGALKEGVVRSGERRMDMIGMGAGVFSICETMCAKSSYLEDYAKQVTSGQLPLQLVYDWTEEDEHTFMAIRGLCRGFTVHKNDRFYPGFEARYREKLDRFRQHGLIAETADKLILTRSGKLWHQNMILEFLNAKHLEGMRFYENVRFAPPPTPTRPAAQV
jgi:oxygen-independent coproporphyrinogen-3 oxidase